MNNDIIYVLTNIFNGSIEMATTDDSEAWKFYRDRENVRIAIFAESKRVAGVEAPKQDR